MSPDRPRPQRRPLRPERLLPFACIAAAVALFASEFMTIFELTRSDVASSTTPCTLDASSRHHFALGVVAIFAVVATVVAVLAGSKPAAIGVAIAGILALLLFLVIDLPDANSIGPFLTRAPHSRAPSSTERRCRKPGSGSSWRAQWRWPSAAHPRHPDAGPARRTASPVSEVRGIQQPPRRRRRSGTAATLGSSERTVLQAIGDRDQCTAI